MATGRQLGRAAAFAGAASVATVILALVAGLAIPRDRGDCYTKSPPNLAGPTGIALYVVAAVGFAAGLALYLLARRKAVKYEPAEGFLILAGIGLVVVYLVLYFAQGCYSSD